MPEGGLPGIFSVSQYKQVYFSRGNAQFNDARGYSTFAEHQWDHVGDEAQGTVYIDGVKCNNNKCDRLYNGWIDLYEWGSGGNPTQNSAKYRYDFFGYKDWGRLSYQNGGYPEHDLWRTLSSDEWYYLFQQRKNAAKLRGQATVNNIHGYILLPDAWQQPEGLRFTPQPKNWTSNTYSSEQWQRMEAAGAVFLPAAGVRNGKQIQGIGVIGAYWTSTMHNQKAENDIEAQLVYFTADEANANMFDTWSRGMSVRLVQDTDFKLPEQEKTSVWDNVTAEEMAQLPELEPEQIWHVGDEVNTIGDMPPREGYRRIKVDPTSFAAFLRNYKLRDGRAYYYDGSLVEDQRGVFNVMDIDIGNKDLLQCADAVMLLRAEYLYEQKRYSDIHFNALSGFKLEYARYAEGERLKNVNGKLTWVKSTKPDYSYPTFRKFMDLVFGYANTASLEKELPKRDIKDLQIGDVFVVSGTPGHAMIVVDMAMNAKGERALLLAQGMMPAQSVHVVSNVEHREHSPWYMIDEYLVWSTLFIFPDYVFSAGDLKCFEP